MSKALIYFFFQMVHPQSAMLRKRAHLGKHAQEGVKSCSLTTNTKTMLITQSRLSSSDRFTSKCHIYICKESEPASS